MKSKVFYQAAISVAKGASYSVAKGSACHSLINEAEGLAKAKKISFSSVMPNTYSCNAIRDAARRYSSTNDFGPYIEMFERVCKNSVTRKRPSWWNNYPTDYRQQQRYNTLLLCAAIIETGGLK